MKKLLLIFLCSTLIPIISPGQQVNYNWRVGVSGGYTNYYGDLSPRRLQGLSDWDAIHHLFYYNENYFDELSFKISVERQLSPSVGLMFSYGQYSFSMSDRYIRRDGTLMMDAPNFDRALNFQNKTRDMGLSFVFKTDNDIILPANSFVAPYFTLGGGFLDFDVRGDLLDVDGNRYDYTDPTVINTGIYETNLPALRTERADGYSTGAFYANFGLGVRFRLGPNLELFAQSDFIHAFTDYLDDVSGTYRETYDNDFQAYAALPGTNVVDPENPQRGNPNSPNDWVIYHGVGLKFNFGWNKKAFRAPVLSTHYPDYTVTSTRRMGPRPAPSDEDTRAERPVTGNSYNYFTNIQMASPQGMDSLAYKSQLLTWEQQSQARKDRILAGQLERNRLREIQQQFDRQYDQLRRDTLLAKETRDSLLNMTQDRRFGLRYSMDSIGRREAEMRSEMDSLQKLKEEHRLPQRAVVFPMDLEEYAWRKEEERDTMPMRPTERDTTLISPAKEPVTEVMPSPAEERTAAPPRQIRDQEVLAMEERIRRLENENLRLQTQQEQMRQRPRENIYITPEPDQRSRRVVPRDPEAREPAGRVQEPSPVLSPGLYRSRPVTPRAPVDAELAPEETAPLDPEMQQNLRSVGLAISSIFLGTPLIIFEPDTVTEEMEEEEMVAEQPVLPDSVIIDEPARELLKSKVEVFFEVNQARPNVEEMKKLAPLVDFVKDNEEYKLSLLGYADNTGNVAYNLKLIESRIEEVKNVLVELYGLSPEQIESEVGGQIVRGARRSANENDRKVEVRIERR